MTRRNRIETRLAAELSPIYLNVEDESHNHHVPENAQTHFKIIVVSPKFIDLTRIERHRLVNNLLTEELNAGLHALSMHLYTEQEWALKSQSIIKSPPCKDGYKNTKSTI